MVAAPRTGALAPTVNPRTTAVLALLVAALGAFVYLYEIRGAEERAEAEAAEKRLFPGVEASEVTAVAMQTSDDRAARLERSDEGWRLVEPLEFPADALAADGLASALAELASEAVFEEPEPLANYGLDGEPALRFTADGAEHALRIGDKTPVGGNTYAAPDEGERVFAVPTWRITPLRKSLAELREARVARFERDAVRRVRLRWPGSELALARAEDGSWRLSEPLDAPADDATVDALLGTLEFMRADGFVDEPVEAERSGLEDPAFVAELELGEGAPGEGGEAAQAGVSEGGVEAGTETLRVVIGSTVDGQERFVRGPDGTLYRIGADRLDDLPRTLAAYRWKTLSRFTASDAQRFEIDFAEGGAEHRVNGRRTDSGWDTEPESFAAGTASRMVAELAALEAHDIAADAVGEAEAAQLGLAPPRAVIRVYGAAPEEGEAPLLSDLRIGVAEPARGIAAQRAGDPVVYWLEFRQAEHLPVNLEALHNRFVSKEPPAETQGEEPMEGEPGAGLDAVPFDPTPPDEPE